MIKTRMSGVLILSTLCVAVAGCRRHGEQDQKHGDRNQSETVAEGVIFSVEYKLENGKTGGFTRINMAEAVPGHNGSWNIDAHGRLTRDYLIITRPQRKDLGPQVIPASRLVSIQFGDGGIKVVNTNQPAKLR